MTDINIIIDGDKRREYSFQTLDDEDAERIINMILNQTDVTIATLDGIGSINAEDPPELEDI